MSSFTDLPIVSPLHNGKEWALRKNFIYEIGFLGSGDKIIVPDGFITDFASVPRIFWSILPSIGKYSSASILHDYLYFSKIKSRKESDKIFYEAMLVSGVKKWKAKIIHKIVRIFGAKPYKKSKRYIIEPLDGYVEVGKIE